MNSVVLKRVLPCSKRELFDAWSKPSIMMKWFFKSHQPRTPSTVHSRFVVGGDFEIIMHMESGDYRHHGTYRAISRYSHIAFTWNSHIVRSSLVELDFRELSPNRAELTLTHTLLPDQEVRDKHTEGWSGCLNNLQRFFMDQKL